MKYIHCSLWSLAKVFLIFFGCTVTASTPDPFQLKMFEVPDDHLPEAKNYRQEWIRLSGFEHSGLHWDQFIVVFTNHAESVYTHNYQQFSAWFDDPDDEDNEPEYQMYPVGAVLLKENFSVNKGKPKKPLTVTAMIKRPEGYDSENGDWEYLQFDHLGNVILRGSAKDSVVHQTCAKCHKNVAERDYIFANVLTNLKRAE